MLRWPSFQTDPPRPVDRDKIVTRRFRGRSARAVFRMATRQGRQDSNLQPPVLEVRRGRSSWIRYGTVTSNEVQLGALSVAPVGRKFGRKSTASPATQLWTCRELGVAHKPLSGLAKLHHTLRPVRSGRAVTACGSPWEASGSRSRPSWACRTAPGSGTCPARLPFLPVRPRTGARADRDRS